MTDYQREKVYRWDSKFINPKIKGGVLPETQMQAIVNYIWSDMGFMNPPKVKVNKAYKVKSTGGRYEILMHTMANERVLVHELAHSVSLKEDQETFDHHGPMYVGIYGALLCRYYGFDPMEIIWSTKTANVDIDLSLLYEFMKKETAA